MRHILEQHVRPVMTALAAIEYHRPACSEHNIAADV